MPPRPAGPARRASAARDRRGRQGRTAPGPVPAPEPGGPSPRSRPSPGSSRGRGRPGRRARIAGRPRRPPVRPAHGAAWRNGRGTSPTTRSRPLSGFGPRRTAGAAFGKMKSLSVMVSSQFHGPAPAPVARGALPVIVGRRTAPGTQGFRYPPGRDRARCPCLHALPEGASPEAALDTPPAGTVDAGSEHSGALPWPGPGKTLAEARRRRIIDIRNTMLLRRGAFYAMPIEPSMISPLHSTRMIWRPFACGGSQRSQFYGR